MNPELPSVEQKNVEVSSGVLVAPDGTGERSSGNPEIQRVPEVNEYSQPSTIDQQYQGIPATLPVVSPPSVQDDAVTSVATDDDIPLLAADDDLIEKEWVDKIKKIIILTKDDPYERSRVIAQLQADYLKKRYNKVLGQDQVNSG